MPTLQTPLIFENNNILFKITPLRNLQIKIKNPFREKENVKNIQNIKKYEYPLLKIIEKLYPKYFFNLKVFNLVDSFDFEECVFAVLQKLNEVFQLKNNFEELKIKEDESEFEISHKGEVLISQKFF